MSKIDLGPVSGAYFDNIQYHGVVLCGHGSEKGEHLYTESQVLEMLRMMREKCLNVVNIWEDEYTVDKINEIPIEIPKGE